MTIDYFLRYSLYFLGLTVSIHSLASDDNPYSQNGTGRVPAHLYWGDTHLHSNLSIDANSYGNKMLSPDDAYRFAMGKTVTAHNGQAVKLSRPLDFLVIADHAHNMGVMTALSRQDPLLLSTSKGQQWFKKLKTLDLNDMTVMSTLVTDPEFGGLTSSGAVRDPEFRQTVWNQVAKKADQYNKPGTFTAFIGYEWTPLEIGRWPGNGYTLHHRVVVFKDGLEKARQVLPFSRFDSEDPEALWEFLASYEETTGGEVIAIPHNGNTSRGQMFAPVTFSGKFIDRDYAKRRSQWEPLVEVTQIKGDSETHPLLSPNDEFADYETWAYELAEGQTEKEGRKYEYSRSALKLGLAHQKQLGINPFKFGMIGSTDAHTSLATADENNFWGKMSSDEPLKDRGRIWSTEKIKGGYSAAGYTAIWAEENTRESLFSAMKRKEVYASTGPRINVRFFGGWDYEESDAFRPDLARIGYEKGVPMGGDIIASPKDKSPVFLIRAVKDPDGANLDRVQMIKGWHDTNGDLHEKIYNVALSDGRVDKGPDTRPVGNTVDLPSASYTNTIGDSELAVVWQDPDFNPGELAFYYLRVLEIPTPRWTAYDAKYFQLKDISEEVPMMTQERAYSSPIWYSPDPKALKVNH